MTRLERNQLVVENDRLAAWYVRRFVALPQTDPGHDDLVQAARLGLIEAARRYDCTRGKFSSYAVWWMNRFVNEAKRASYVIRLGRSKREIPVPGFVDPDLLDTLIADQAAVDLAIDAGRVRELVHELNDRERSLIEQRWLSFDPATLREIGERLGLSPEGARYIEECAFSKLRRLMALKLPRAARRRRRARVLRGRVPSALCRRPCSSTA
jgi:RNA polymerase sigma factor (sigma-70 family)